jgi:hypothetical protein
MRCANQKSITDEEAVQALVELFGVDFVTYLLCEDLQTGKVSDAEFSWTRRMLKKWEHLDKPIQ